MRESGVGKDRFMSCRCNKAPSHTEHRAPALVDDIQAHRTGPVWKVNAPSRGASEESETQIKVR